MRDVQFKPKALEDLEYWLLNDKKILARIFKILKECQKTPFEGTAKPEPLKGNLQGFWSRRINDEHRLVYEVTDKFIIVHLSKGHY